MDQSGNLLGMEQGCKQLKLCSTLTVIRLLIQCMLWFITIQGAKPLRIDISMIVMKVLI